MCVTTYKPYQRNVRDSNPWPLPWQGSVIANLTNTPLNRFFVPFCTSWPTLFFMSVVTFSSLVNYSWLIVNTTLTALIPRIKTAFLGFIYRGVPPQSSPVWWRWRESNPCLVHEHYKWLHVYLVGSQLTNRKLQIEIITSKNPRTGFSRAVRCAPTLLWWCYTLITSVPRLYVNRPEISNSIKR